MVGCQSLKEIDKWPATYATLSYKDPALTEEVQKIDDFDLHLNTLLYTYLGIKYI